MAEPLACLDCLRRSWLLAALGPYVEQVASGKTGSRSPELLRLSNEDLVEIAAPKVGVQMLARMESLSEERLREELLVAECWACCRHDELYPDSLRDGAAAPWALIGRGDPRILDDLDAGRTIAVLGCGPDVAYPASHRSLWRRICEGGLVISEFPPGATPWRWTFPARNRIMAALAGMTVVVEAATRSGSLITADLAAELGRDLGAVPGPVTSRASAGPNALLASGAHVIRDAQDVLDYLLGPGHKTIERRTCASLDRDLRRVLEAVKDGNSTCDAVAIVTGLSAPTASAALSRLELLGHLNCSSLGTYRCVACEPRCQSPGEVTA